MNFNSEFQSACKNGFLSQAKYYRDKYDIDVGADFSRGFILACANGHINVVKWLINFNNIDPSVYFYKGFLSACQNGHVRVVRWLLNFDFIRDVMEAECPIINACNYGHYDVVEALLLSKHFRREIFYLPIILIKTAENGSVQIFQLILSHFGPVKLSYIKQSFDTACNCGNVNLAQWIAKEYVDINVVERAVDLFQDVYWRDHLQMAKWLYSIITTNINIDLHAYRTRGYNLQTLKWLYECHLLKKIDYQMLFSDCCISGCIDVCEWIMSFNDLILDNDTASRIFMHCCINGIKNVQWLTTKYPNSDFTIGCESWFIEVCIKGSRQMVDYIAKHHPVIIEKFCANTARHDLKNLARVYMSNDVQLIEYLKKLGIDLRQFIPEYFELACQYGHLEMAQYMDQEFIIKKKIYCRAFENVTNIDVLQWLFETRSEIITSKNIRQCFVNAACLYKCKIMYYIQANYSQHLKISTYFKAAKHFCSCYNISIYGLQWLFKICPEITQHDYIINIFNEACIEDNIQIAKYLLSKYEIDLSQINNKLFLKYCNYASITLINWLFDLGLNIDINADNYKLFENIGSESVEKYKIKKFLIRKYDILSAPALLEISCKKSDIKIIDYIIQWFDIHEIQINVEYQNIVDNRISHIHNTSAAIKSANN